MPLLCLRQIGVAYVTATSTALATAVGLNLYTKVQMLHAGTHTALTVFKKCFVVKLIWMRSLLCPMFKIMAKPTYK